MTTGILEQLPSMKSERRDYLLQALPTHLAKAGDGVRLHRLLTDFDFLQAKSDWLGVETLLADLRRAGGMVLPTAEARQEIEALTRTLDRELHRLRGWRRHEAPALFVQQLSNRAVILGYNALAVGAAAYLARRHQSYLALSWYASSESMALERTLTGHRGWVTALALASDDRRAVSVGTDMTLRLWDITTGEELSQLQLAAHQDRVRALALTADGCYAVTGGWDTLVCVWDLQTMRLKYRLAGHQDWVSAVAVTPNGRLAVSASYDRTLIVWDLTIGHALRTFKGHRSRVRAVAIALNGKIVISGSESGRVICWSLVSGKQIFALDCRPAAVDRLERATDSRFVVVCEDAGFRKLRREFLKKGPDISLRFWEDVFRGGATHGYRAVMADWKHSERLHPFALGGEGGVRNIALTPDDRYVLVAGHDRLLRIFDLASGVLAAQVRGHEDKVNAVAVTRDSQRIVTAGDDGTVRVWSLPRALTQAEPAGHRDWVHALAITSNGHSGLTLSRDGTLKIWELATGQQIETIDLAAGAALEERPGNLTLTSDGRYVGWTIGEHTIAVYNLVTGAGTTVTVELDPHDSLTTLRLAPHGRRVVCVSNRGVLSVIDLDTRAVRRLDEQPGLAAAIFVPAHNWLLTTHDERGEVDVRDADSGQYVHVLAGHSAPVRAITFVQHGRYALTAGEDGIVKVWNLDAFQDVRTFAGHRSAVIAVAASPDGRRVVCADANAWVYLWDIVKSEVMAMAIPSGLLYSVALSPDGETVLVGDRAGNVYCLHYVRGV